MNEALSYADGTFGDKWRDIYINGEKYHATARRIGAPDFDGAFFVDSPELPFRRCSQHTLKSGATAHLEAGGRILSSGTWYSLKELKS